MDSQDPLPVEARKGAIPKSANADEAKPPAQETSSGAKTPDTDSKLPSGRKEQHKKATKAKQTKKAGRPSPKKGSKKQPAPASDSSDSSDSGDDLSSSSSSKSDDSESESEVDKKKRSAKKRHEPAASKKKRGKKDVVVDPEAKYASDSAASDVEAGDANERLLVQQQQHEITRLRRQVQQLQLQSMDRGSNFNVGLGGRGASLGVLPPGLRRNDYIEQDDLSPATLPVFDPIRPSRFLPPAGRQPLGSPLSIDPRLPQSAQRQGQSAQQSSKRKPARLEYKRVDQVWDNTIHAYKLQDTAEASIDAQYDEYLFHVRRSFDWEGKFKHTFVDIKSKLLRECLQDVMGNIKGVSLVEDTPKLDPNMLFL